MHLRKRPELEPLDAATWTRIERDLFAKVDQPNQAPPALRLRPAVAFALAGAAAAIVLGLGLQALTRAPTSAGNASRIVTHNDGSHFEITGAALDVSPDSALLVSGDDEHGISVILDRGSVTCEVAPRKGRPPFVVRAGDVTVKVIGTHFTVRRTGDSGGVQVERGVVEVSAHGEVALVGAGTSWPLAPISAEQLTDDVQHLSLAAPAPPGSGTQANVRPSTSAKPSSPQELYEAATGFEARRPEQAIVIYRELAKADGPWAANGLFAEGRLEADRGHRVEARTLLSAYLKRFPRGANAEDARQLLERL